MDADDRKRLRDAAVACIAATNRVREAEEKGEPAPYKESFRARAMFQEVLDGPVESAAWVVQMLDALDAAEARVAEHFECMNAALDKLNEAEARAEKAESEWDRVGVCDTCDNLSEDLLDSEGQEQCSACRRLAAMTAERDRLREALLEVVSWIDNWGPSFTEDGEWPATAQKVRALLNRPECREVGDE